MAEVSSCHAVPSCMTLQKLHLDDRFPILKHLLNWSFSQPVTLLIIYRSAMSYSTIFLETCLRMRSSVIRNDIQRLLCKGGTRMEKPPGRTSL
jgi:hypothetical protein